MKSRYSLFALHPDSSLARKFRIRFRQDPASGFFLVLAENSRSHVCIRLFRRAMSKAVSPGFRAQGKPIKAPAATRDIRGPDTLIFRNSHLASRRSSRCRRPPAAGAARPRRSPTAQPRRAEFRRGTHRQSSRLYQHSHEIPRGVAPRTRFLGSRPQAVG